jgi:hypothetical protein
MSDEQPERDWVRDTPADLKVAQMLTATILIAGLIAQYKLDYRADALGFYEWSAFAASLVVWIVWGIGRLGRKPR